VTQPELSFEAFYAAEYASVVRLAFALSGRLAVAEEMAQEAFLAAYRRWNRIEQYDVPGAWVRRVVTHRCVSTWRRGLTEARLVARLRRERPPEVVFSPSDERVWREVARLPGRQRQVIALVVVEDRSVAEVAHLLGCSEESVRTHLRRARLRLAERLHEEDPT
jgi:RNA polymerase sigma-70 factor (ECF subfamily)